VLTVVLVELSIEPVVSTLISAIGATGFYVVVVES